MTGTTANGLPYPVLTEDANGPQAFQDFAEAVDAAYGSAVADVAALPLVGDFLGQRILCIATAEVAEWNGTIWTGIVNSVVPTWTNVTLGTTGLVNTMTWAQFGKRILGEFQLTLGTGGTLTGSLTLALPVAAANANISDIGVVRINDVSPANRYHGWMVKSTAALAIFDYMNATPVGQVVNNASPMTPAVGDSYAGSFNYWAA